MLTNFSNDKQIHESLENNFHETTFHQTNAPEDCFVINFCHYQIDIYKENNIFSDQSVCRV